MTELEAEKKAVKNKGYVFRTASAWDAAWDWCVRGDAKWQKIKAGKLRIDKRTLRKA